MLAFKFLTPEALDRENNIALPKTDQWFSFYLIFLYIFFTI